MSAQTTHKLHSEINSTMPAKTLSNQHTILIVGNKAETSSIAQLLGSLYNICMVDDLDEVISKAADLDPVLALVFSRVGNTSGLHCVQALKEDPLLAHFTILFVLEENSPAEELKALQLGVLDCLAKPLNPIILNAKIENHVIAAEQKLELELTSCTDGLTGLANRTQLDSTLLQEWYVAKRGQHPISVLMIDIDFFKSFNDNFGHLEGDKCLKKIAKAIKNMRRRQTDFAARFGGEEFVMILPFTGSEGAIKVAKNLVKKIRKLNIPKAPNTDEHVTVSVGVSTCHPHLGLDECADHMAFLTNADSKLYEAKRTGRDKVCFDIDSEKKPQ